MIDQSDLGKKNWFWAYKDKALHRGQGRNPYKKFVGILVDQKTPKGHFEIN